MPNPQSPELRRSATTASQSPDSVSSQREADRPVGRSGETGPVPEDNRPGHHPDHDQDRPDLDAFADRLGVPSTDDPDDIVVGVVEPASDTGDGARRARIARILARRG